MRRQVEQTVTPRNSIKIPLHYKCFSSEVIFLLMNASIRTALADLILVPLKSGTMNLEEMKDLKDLEQLEQAKRLEELEMRSLICIGRHFGILACVSIGTKTQGIFIHKII